MVIKPRYYDNVILFTYTILRVCDAWYSPKQQVIWLDIVRFAFAFPGEKCKLS